VDTNTEFPLFVDDDRLRARLAPQMGKDRFRAAVRSLERTQGFPRTHALWKGRYWPAVKAWMDQDQGVRDGKFIGSYEEAEDGPEHWDDLTASP